MIYIIGIGSNMPSKYGDSVKSLKTVIKKLKKNNIHIIKKSSLYSSPPKNFNRAAYKFVNGAIMICSTLKPENLLMIFKKIETEMGRNIYKKNESRTCDLDILLMRPGNSLDSQGNRGKCLIPHPRLHEREFVLKPMMDICRNWIHSEKKQTISEIYRSSNIDDKVYKIAETL